jgi:hypothetical protein
LDIDKERSHVISKKSAEGKEKHILDSFTEIFFSYNLDLFNQKKKIIITYNCQSKRKGI